MSRSGRRPPLRLLMIGWLVTVWLLLWEEPSPANLLGGVALGSALVVLFPLRPRGIPGAFRLVETVRFFLYFMWKLVEASFVVSWEVVTPHNRINEGIVAVPIHGVSDTLTTLVANAISLTPGTLTLEVRRHPTVLYVHVLHLHDIDAVRREVQLLEVLAIRAFGSAAAIATAEAEIGDDGAATASSPPGRRDHGRGSEQP